MNSVFTQKDLASFLFGQEYVTYLLVLPVTIGLIFAPAELYVRCP